LIAVLVAFTSGVSYGEEQPPGGKYGKLSEAFIHNRNTGIYFFEPPKEVLVNYKMLKSDFQLYNGMVTFRLEGTQRNIHLECGLSDYGPERASNQLTVIGDGKELFSRGYNAGENAAVSDIDIKGVQALTFKLGGTTSGYFYCKDEIRY
jgi:hypothetical protein